jgi:hypothetical protein
MSTPKAIAYWTTTALLVPPLFLGGLLDVASKPDVVAFFADLGYPAYFGPIVGTWKVLASVVLLAPRLPRVKEWAYAGIFFDLTGAAISQAASGHSGAAVIFPLVLAALAVASWALRPGARQLTTLAAA